MLVDRVSLVVHQQIQQLIIKYVITPIKTHLLSLLNEKITNLTEQGRNQRYYFFNANRSLVRKIEHLANAIEAFDFATYQRSGVCLASYIVLSELLVASDEVAVNFNAMGELLRRACRVDFLTIRSAMLVGREAITKDSIQAVTRLENKHKPLLRGEAGSDVGSDRVLPLYNVGYIAAGTPKSLTFSQN